MHSANYAVARSPHPYVCLSVRLSVTQRYSVEMAKHIIKRFSLSSSHTFLVFPHQTLWQYSDTPNDTDTPVSFLMIMNDPKDSSQGHAIISCCISQKWLKIWPSNANSKPYRNFQMVPFSSTLSELKT